MMYNNKLAFAIKSNGRVLREFGDKVYVPFGTEYTILIKNLHTTRVLLNITIDGKIATENGLVLNAGKEIELERFIKTDLNKGNKFKFIERTSSIEKNKGIGLEDGLIVINYQFEENFVYSYPKINPFVLYDGYMPSSRDYDPFPSVTWTCNTNSIENACSATTTLSSVTRATNASNNVSKETNVNGITVPGSISEQKFSTTTIGRLEPTKHSMVIKLLGETDDQKPVNKPVTVDIKPKCVTCFKINKATNKFCSACGTSLQILA